MIRNEYFSHIDVLRFIAVFSVILFHADRNLFPGGYLGVDIFFVISGFVITHSLFKEFQKKKHIDIINFYARRFKRIYPVLIFVLIISLIFYLIFGILNDAETIFNSSFFSLFGISNFFFIHINEDYFLSNDNNFFIHTWSLAIEEQFYFIYPFLFFFIFKFFNRNNIILFSLITILFFLIFFSFDLTKKNFFLPYFRAWELSIGCLAFLLLKKIRKKIIFYYIEYFFLLIILLMLFTNIVDLSIKNEIIITIFSLFFFLITFKDKKKNFFFKNKILNYLGKASYSIYLWHLPIFYFTSLINLNFIFQFFIIIIISIFSYHFVENKFRYSNNFYNYSKLFIKKFFLPLILLYLFFFIFFQNLINKSNQIIHDNKGLLYELNINPKNDYLKNNLSYREYNFLLNAGNYCLQEKEISFYFDNCFKRNNSKDLFLLAGDSTAASLLPLFDKYTGHKLDLLFIGKSGNFVAPGLLSYSDELLNNKNFKSGTSDQTFNNNLFETSNKLSKKYNKVYLFLSSDYFTYISKWNLTDLNINKIPENKKKQAIEKSFNQINKNLNQNIDLIFLIKPFQTKNSLIDCLIGSGIFEDCINYGIKSSMKNFNYFVDALRNVVSKNPNNYVLDFSNFICNNNKCSNFIDKKKVLINDKVHFTIHGNFALLNYFKKWFYKTYEK